MIIENRSYNIPKVTVSGTITAGNNKVGTEAEYNKLRSLVSDSGLFYGEMNLSGANMKGSMICNVADEGIEMFTVTNYGNNPRIIIGYLIVDNGDALLNLTVLDLN